MGPNDGTVRTIAERMARDLADQGRVLEAGWQMYRLLLLKVPAHEARDELREAFEAGAEYIFGTLMAMLEPGEMETGNDLRRMHRLNAELQPIRERLKLKYGRTAGRA